MGRGLISNFNNNRCSQDFLVTSTTTPSSATPLKKGGVYYFNVQSLIKNRNLILLFVENVEPDIIMMSETHITEDIEECEIDINGYNLIQLIT